MKAKLTIKLNGKVKATHTISSETEAKGLAIGWETANEYVLDAKDRIDIYYTVKSKL